MQSVVGAYPLLRSVGQPVRSGPLPLHGQSPLAPCFRTTEPEGTRPVGAYATAHPPLAASGPYLSSLSLAPSARHHLRQEPDAGNPPVRICAGGTAKAVTLPRHHSSRCRRQRAPDKWEMLGIWVSDGEYCCSFIPGRGTNQTRTLAKRSMRPPKCYKPDCIGKTVLRPVRNGIR